MSEHYVWNKGESVKLAVPTVHLNGTSKGELLEQLKSAYQAIRVAERALARAAPHGRDYYVQEGDGIKFAMQQHGRRLRKLDEIAGELEQIAIAVDEQNR